MVQTGHRRECWRGFDVQFIMFKKIEVHPMAAVWLYLENYVEFLGKLSYENLLKPNFPNSRNSYLLGIRST